MALSVLQSYEIITKGSAFMLAIAENVVNQSKTNELLQLSQSNSPKSQVSSSEKIEKQSESFSEMVEKYKKSDENQKTEEKNENVQNSEKIEDKNESKVENQTENKKIENDLPTSEKIKNQKNEIKNSEKNVETEVLSEKKLEKTKKQSKKQNNLEKNENVENGKLNQFEEFASSLVKNQTEKKSDENEIKKNDFFETEKIAENLETENKIISFEENNLEKVDLSKIEEKKSSPKKKEFKFDKDGKIQVQDLRTEKEFEVENKESKKIKPTINLNSENSATMTLNFSEENANTNILSLNNQTASANGSNFQAMLNNQIQNNVPEFVKAGNLVLKDNNQGTIDLILKPEHLGNVKIHLSLDGKNLSGQISVVSKEALEVFKDNSETLREAFIKNGFDSANFEISYGNNGGNQNFEFEQRNDGTKHFGKFVYENDRNSFVNENTNFVEKSEKIGNYSINIVA